jgi:hypothetical protein
MEWRSKALPRHWRLTKKAEGSISLVYLAEANTSQFQRVVVGLFR